MAVSWITFEVRADSGDVSKAGLYVDGDHGANNLAVDVTGRTTLAVRPGHEYEVSTHLAGFVTKREKVTAPVRGLRRTHAIVLKRQRPRATLRVLLKGVDKAPLRAGFGLFAEGRARPVMKRDAEPDDGGVYVLEGLEPGAYTLRVHAGSLWDYPLSLFIPAQVQVVLPEGGEAETEVAVRLGGRLRMRATMQDGGPLRCKCEVRDVTGRRMELLFITADKAYSRTWLDDEFSESAPALDPGTYTVRFFRDGYRTETRAVGVRVGEVTPVEVSLVKE